MSLTASSDVGQTIGDPYTAFLLGYPDYTEVNSTNNSTMDGFGYSWAAFAQDDWKVSEESHAQSGPALRVAPAHSRHALEHGHLHARLDGHGTDGVTKVNGAVVVPNAQASKNASQQFRNGIAPTPILTASQAGIPESLRFTDHTDFGPRLGFAWRPLGQRPHGFAWRLGALH